MWKISWDWIAHRPIQRVTRDLTPVVEEFIDSLEEPDAEEEGPILIETLDQRDTHVQTGP